MLVTIGIKCFNQKDYIGAAIEAALKQTYRPLEIVVSDDGSTDGSFAVIEDVLNAGHFVTRRIRQDLNAYAPRNTADGISTSCLVCDNDPSITVVLNRNEVNLGNCGNWEKICELAKGEWIFKFDGDDLSDPERVAKVVAAIRAHEGRPLVASCGALEIDLKGKVVGRRKAPRMATPVGAMMAFHKSLFERFERVKYPRVMDDVVWARRAELLGGEEVRIDDPLVMYRLQSGVSGEFGSTREVVRRCLKTAFDEFAQARLDCAAIGAGAEVLERIEAQERATRHIERLVNDGSLREKIAAIRACSPGRSLSGKAFLWLCLLPGRFGDEVIRLTARVRHWAKR